MSNYKTTGRDTDPEKVTLIVEELNHPDEPIRSVKEIIGERQKPKGGQTNENRKFFLENQRTKERHIENGVVQYYSSKNAAKRVRNKLNSRGGSGAYHVVAVDFNDFVQELLDMDDFDSRFPPFINFCM